MSCFRCQQSPPSPPTPPPPPPMPRTRQNNAEPKNPICFSRREGLVKLPESEKAQFGLGAERMKSADTTNVRERLQQELLEKIKNRRIEGNEVQQEFDPRETQDSARRERKRSSFSLEDYDKPDFFPTIDRFYNSVNVLGLNGCNWEKFLPCQKAAFVLFYDPNDSKSCLTKRNYTQAACEDGQTVYTAVDCSQEGSLCKTENINSYPTVKFFRRGRFVNTFGLKELMDNSLPRLANPKSAARQR